MSRILTLIVFVLWLAWADSRTLSPSPAGGARAWAARFWDGGVGESMVLFVGGLLCIVLLLGVWNRVLARHVASMNLHRSLRRFNQSLAVARFLIPLWFAVGLWVLGWGDVVHRLIDPLARWPIKLPGLLVGTFPPFLAWAGLWWAQFPADRALRNQNLLIHLDEGLPVHAPPRFRTFLASNLRLQILFTAAPVALIVLVRDLVALVLWRAGWTPMSVGPLGVALPPETEALVQFGSAAAVFLVAPEILRRVLRTRPLPPSPLRRRLEEMCRRSNLRYRDILLWQTDNNMCNAAVMGIVPQVRYILLSDLLIETMSDEQIEAVFAHEVGHVIHRHMVWYVIFVLVYLCLALAAEEVIARLPNVANWAVLDVATGIAGVAAFFLLLGYLSRWFERQADVYAARTIQMHNGPAVGDLRVPGQPHLAAELGLTAQAPSSLGTVEPDSYVGHYGATIFGSALRRVAVINNIPIAARNFSHGSIAQRVSYLQELSGDPARTGRFDRVMTGIYGALLAALAVGAGAVAVVLMMPGVR